MKYLDEVEVTTDTPQYLAQKVHKGMIGTIIDPEIRDCTFNVIFIDERFGDPEFFKNEDNMYLLKDDIICPIDIRHLKLVLDNHSTDEMIIDSLPSPDLRWWCKVENGYILNAKGERKNKVAYDYDS